MAQDQGALDMSALEQHVKEIHELLEQQHADDIDAWAILSSAGDELHHQGLDSLENVKDLLQAIREYRRTNHV